GYESEEPTLAEGEASRVHMFLFDTSPPSYTLNSDYRILDWNPAFELVFNTSELHHGDHVSHWINQLSNKEQIHRHAKEVFADNRIPLADVEPIEFFSPVFGKMLFDKITSPATDGSGAVVGWNVILNVAEVEGRQQFYDALSKKIEEDAGWRMYSASYDK